MKIFDFSNMPMKPDYLDFFNDFTIKVQNKTFPANRMVLSCYSKFFEKTFQVEMKEKYENSVTIHNMSTKSMQTIIDFIYTGKIVIDNESVIDLLSAADYLFVDEVKQYFFCIFGFCFKH